MKNRSLMAGGALALAFTTPVVGEPDPIAEPEMGSLVFDVLRNGNDFGLAQFDFTREGEDLTVTSKIKMRVPFFFRFVSETSEVWRDGALQSLRAEVDDDGEDRSVTINRGEDGLAIDGTAFMGVVDDVPFTTSWWNRAVVSESKLINSQDGEVLDITVTDLGRETIETYEGGVDATCYSVAATLTLKLCYDDADRWVKTQFDARGQNIEYVLVDGVGG